MYLKHQYHLFIKLFPNTDSSGCSCYQNNSPFQTHFSAGFLAVVTGFFTI